MRSCRTLTLCLAIAGITLGSVANISLAQTASGAGAVPNQGGQPAGMNGQLSGAGNVGGNGIGNGVGQAFNPAGRNSQSDYPAAEVQTVPIARARFATARAEQDQMLAELHMTVDRLREDFNYSEPMIAALREENSAFLAYDDARRKVLETLSGDSTYRAMVSLVSTLKSKLEEERPRGPKPSPEDLERLMATATLKLSYASAASAMESASLSADDRVQQTRARLVTAGQKTAGLRADFERSVHRNGEFLAARRNLDDARITRITADAFLDGAIDARDFALHYAYYIHRFDQYSYSPALLGSNLYYGAGNGFYGR